MDDSQTEPLMPLTSEQTVADLHARQGQLDARQGQLDASLTTLTASVGVVAKTQQAQTEQIAKLTELSTANAIGISRMSDFMKDLHAATKEQWGKIDKWAGATQVSLAREGRFSLGQLFQVLAPIGAFLAILAAMYIAPLQQKVSVLESSVQQHTVLPGHPETMVYQATSDARIGAAEKVSESYGRVFEKLADANVLRDKERTALTVSSQVLTRRLDDGDVRATKHYEEDEHFHNDFVALVSQVGVLGRDLGKLTDRYDTHHEALLQDFVELKSRVTILEQARSKP